MGYGCLWGLCCLEASLSAKFVLYQVSVRQSTISLSLRLACTSRRRPGSRFGFVGNYAPRGLSPQIDGMPVILKKERISVLFSLGNSLKCLNPSSRSLKRVTPCSEVWCLCASFNKRESSGTTASLAFNASLSFFENDFTAKV